MLVISGGKAVGQNLSAGRTDLKKQAQKQNNKKVPTFHVW